MAKDFSIVDEVISRIIVELDAEHAEYQRLFRRFNQRPDANSFAIHKIKIDLCERIRKELSQAERK